MRLRMRLPHGMRSVKTRPRRGEMAGPGCPVPYRGIWRPGRFFCGGNAWHVLDEPYQMLDNNTDTIFVKGGYANMAYYHCLLFDLDGTLLDFGAAEDAAIHETLAYYGFAQPQEAVDAYKQINSALWAALERGEVRQEKLVVQRFEKLLADFGVQGDAVAMNDHYLTRLSERADVYPGAREVLQELAEVATLAVVTNGVDRVQAGRLQRSGLAPYFDGVFVSSRVGASKPARKIFDRALSTLGVENREKVLMIGDSLKADIAGAQNAGLAACWCDYAGRGLPGRDKGHPCDSKPGRAVPHRYGAGGAGACWK